MTPDAMNKEQINAKLSKLLLNDDLTCKTYAQIAEAVMSGMRTSDGMGSIAYEWSGQRFTIQTPSTEWGYGGVDRNNGYALWAWHERYGKDYQFALESHVAAYWRKPFDFATPDGMLTLMELMPAKGYYVALNAGYDKRYAVAGVLGHDGPEPHYFQAASVAELPLALASVALAALEEK